MIQEIQTKVDAAACFPSILNDQTNYQAVTRFQNFIDSAAAGKEDVCTFCGLFIAIGSKQRFKKHDFLLQNAFYTGLLIEQQLDNCRKHGLGSNEEQWLYEECTHALTLGKVPKFRGSNHVNVTACHQFSAKLVDLTLVEKAVIARAHPVISILKLRPIGESDPATTYQRIRGHAVVFPQNPGLLLQLLPSATFQPHEVIKVVWASDKPYTPNDLQQYLQIRKPKVKLALEWLRNHNNISKDIVIDYNQLRK